MRGYFMKTSDHLQNVNGLFSKVFYVFVGELLTKKLLQAIARHCTVICETKNHFGFEYENFEGNIIYQNAVLTPIVQIGELVKRLPNEFKQQYTEIPWRNIAGMRDIVVHSYETIDKVILWSVANTETPKIKDFCINLLNTER